MTEGDLFLSHIALLLFSFLRFDGSNVGLNAACTLVIPGGGRCESWEIASNKMIFLPLQLVKVNTFSRLHVIEAPVFTSASTSPGMVPVTLSLAVGLTTGELV